MTQTEELRLRYEAEKKSIEARIEDLKRDMQIARNDIKESKEKELHRLRSKLDELQVTAEEGWNNLTERAAQRVNELIDTIRNEPR